jgi:hypothetical protein
MKFLESCFTRTNLSSLARTADTSISATNSTKGVARVTAEDALSAVGALDTLVLKSCDLFIPVVGLVIAGRCQ